MTIEGWSSEQSLDDFLNCNELLHRYNSGIIYSPYITDKLIPVINGYKIYIANGLRTTAGKIYFNRRVIGLHPIYFHDRFKYKEDFVNTFFHEISHAIAYHCKGEAGHGPVWQHVFANFGFIPTRCHENGKEFLDFKDREVNAIADELGDLF